MIYAVVFVVLMVISILFVRENPNASVEEPLRIREAFAVTLKNGPYWVFNISYLLAAVGARHGLVDDRVLRQVRARHRGRRGLDPHGDDVRLGDPDGGRLVLGGALARQRCARTSCRSRCSRSPSSRCSSPATSCRDSSRACASRSASPGHFVIPLLVQAQIIDVDAAKTGRRREGMYLSVGNVLVRASALVTAIAFWLVGIVVRLRLGR